MHRSENDTCKYYLCLIPSRLWHHRTAIRNAEPQHNATNHANDDTQSGGSGGSGARPAGTRREGVGSGKYKWDFVRTNAGLRQNTSNTPTRRVLRFGTCVQSCMRLRFGRVVVRRAVCCFCAGFAVTVNSGLRHASGMERQREEGVDVNVVRMQLCDMHAEERRRRNGRGDRIVTTNQSAGGQEAGVGREREGDGAGVGKVYSGKLRRRATARQYRR